MALGVSGSALSLGVAGQPKPLAACMAGWVDGCRMLISAQALLPRDTGLWVPVGKARGDPAVDG